VEQQQEQRTKDVMDLETMEATILNPDNTKMQKAVLYQTTVKASTKFPKRT